jgi:threonine dehydratase
LSSKVPAAGVIAASGGNAGLGVAYAARAVGAPAEIFVPESTPAIKISRLHDLGAQVVVTGAFYGDAATACSVRAAESGKLLVHAYDQPEVAAGNGTVGLELAPYEPDTVLVAVGGGGLIGGIAAALEGGAKVVAVEPTDTQALHAALAAGRPVDVTVGGVAADSLGAPRVGEICYAVAMRTGMDSVVVPDEAITEARRLLWEELRIVAEPGGATALAALVCGAYKPSPGERVAVVVCGGNTDPASI